MDYRNTLQLDDASLAPAGSAAATNSSQYNSQQAGSKQGSSTSGEDSSDALHDEVESESEGVAGNGVVGVFVAGWMFLIALMLKLLRPVAFLLRPVSRQLRRLRPGLARRKLKKLVSQETGVSGLSSTTPQPCSHIATVGCSGDHTANEKVFLGGFSPAATECKCLAAAAC